MNEQIEELALKAGFITDKLGNLFGGDEIEKFAELIIDKCLDIIDEHVPGMDGVHAMKKIQEHFGVES